MGILTNQEVVQLRYPNAEPGYGRYGVCIITPISNEGKWWKPKWRRLHKHNDSFYAVSEAWEDARKFVEAERENGGS